MQDIVGWRITGAANATAGHDVDLIDYAYVPLLFFPPSSPPLHILVLFIDIVHDSIAS